LPHVQIRVGALCVGLEAIQGTGHCFIIPLCERVPAGATAGVSVSQIFCADLPSVAEIYICLPPFLTGN
jgi:hypothetical protein